MKKINPDDLDVNLPVNTMAGAVSDIIDRFDGQVFTIPHIHKVMETHPEYVRMRGQKGFYDAVRNYLWRQAKAGKIVVIGKYKHTRNRAYKAVRNGD